MELLSTDLLSSDFSNPVINRVAESEIHVYNLENLWDGKPVVEFDLAPYLFKGLMLKEKDFREAMKALDWSVYADKHVAIYCSTDAIIPRWGFMLVASYLHNIASSVAFGQTADLLRDHFTRALAAEDWSQYEGKMMVLKGCNSPFVPVNAYILATESLQSVAKKLMYGEPCSAVPIWRKKKG
jgi:hypothetical protein